MEFKGKKWKRKDMELKFVGRVRNEGVEKGLVQVKVRNSVGKEVVIFVTVRLDEFLRAINEGKLERI